MHTLLRSNITVVWVALMVATGLSWALGTGHGLPGADHETASVFILVVAVTKVRFVGLYFMELRDAPRVLRGLFEGYCAVLVTLLIILFLAG